MAIPRPSINVPLTLNNVTAKAVSEAARYTALCNDLNNIMQSAEIRAVDIATPKPHLLPVSSLPPLLTIESDGLSGVLLHHPCSECKIFCCAYSSIFTNTVACFRCHFIILMVKLIFI
jgi:hypothetical protein